MNTKVERRGSMSSKEAADRWQWLKQRFHMVDLLEKRLSPGHDGYLYAMLEFQLLSESHTKSLKKCKEETELNCISERNLKRWRISWTGMPEWRQEDQLGGAEWHKSSMFRVRDLDSNCSASTHPFPSSSIYSAYFSTSQFPPADPLPLLPATHPEHLHQIRNVRHISPL